MKSILTCSLVLSLILLAGCAAEVTGSEESLQDSVLEEGVLYYFWGFCPLCDKPDTHLDRFEQYPIEIEVHEIIYNADSLDKFNRAREELGIDLIIFPIFIYNHQYWIGYSETVTDEVAKAIEASFNDGAKSRTDITIKIPLVGEVDLLSSPVFLATLIIAFLDGFNPCSFFVLTFLLAIIVHSASRKRILLVGLTFLIVTSLVYGLFIVGALNIMLIASQLFWIRNFVATLVIILGILGIKDFFAFKEGFSTSIPDSYKTKYYSQVRRVFYSQSIVPMVTATAVMALGIALVELPCTAGFPFIWSGILAGLDLSTLEYIFLFALYLTIYFIDEFFIFLLAVLKMRTVKLTEESGRFLKLVAGVLMLVLGFVLLLKPSLMESIKGILVAFTASFMLILMIYGFRRFLPTQPRNR